MLRGMKWMLSFALVVMGLAAPCMGQDKGSWRAESKTASSITGDLGLSNDKLYLNFTPFTVASIRALTAGELSALFSAEGETNGAGFLYRVNIPGERKFLHKNNLCAAEDVQYMATSVTGKTLRVAFFSGAKMPVLTIDAMVNTTDLCGTFTYSR
jgi:hypothetical protein